jgi:hypothetical protein
MKRSARIGISEGAMRVGPKKIAKKPASSSIDSQPKP